MGEYVLTLLAAAAVTYLLTPAVRRLAVAVGAVHAPRDRDVHVVPTPLLGGFAMLGSANAPVRAGMRLATSSPVASPAYMANPPSRGVGTTWTSRSRGA